MIRRLPAVVLSAAAVLLIPTIVAAAEPVLTATVIPGQEIDLVGSGFPAGSDIALVIQRNGADAGSQALTTDANGGFMATIDAGPGRGGVYTVTATSGSMTATVQALAVETAGGLQSTPPPTDMAESVAHGATSSNAAELAILALIAACSLSYVVSTRRLRDRRAATPANLR